MNKKKRIIKNIMEKWYDKKKKNEGKEKTVYSLKIYGRGHSHIKK
jgi:hypothetical protein